MIRKFGFILLVAILLLSGCASLDNAKPSVAVSASASVKVDPDIAYFRIAAEAIRETTEGARVDMNRIVNASVDILTGEYKIALDDISTDYVSLNPYSEWINGERVHKGYSASQAITVTLRDIDLIGKIIDSLSMIDGVSVSSVEFAIEDASEVEKEVRKMAVQNAWIKASSYAEGAGATLGSVISISDGTTYSQMKYSDALVYATSNYSSSGSTSYYEGKVTVSDSVSVIYSLED